MDGIDITSIGLSDLRSKLVSCGDTWLSDLNLITDDFAQTFIPQDASK